MSPHVHMGISERGGFPRVSGDEPYSTNTTGKDTTFSPRERG